jgi:hypothetical protein
MPYIQMNILKAREKLTYGEVVLPGKKSSFFLKHMADNRARLSEPNRIPSCSFGEIDWDTYVRKEVSPIEAK